MGWGHVEGGCGGCRVTLLGTGSWGPPRSTPKSSSERGGAAPASAGRFLRHAGGGGLQTCFAGTVQGGGCGDTGGVRVRPFPLPGVPRAGGTAWSLGQDARGCVAHPSPVLAAFPASSPQRGVVSPLHVASSLTAESPAPPPLPSIPACLPRCRSPPGLAAGIPPAPARRGGARHLGLSGGSCEMSANILCGLPRQASRRRCWRASGNRSPDGDKRAHAGWAMSRHPRLRRCAGTWRSGGMRGGCGDGLTPGTRCHRRLPGHCCNVSPQPY